MKKFIRVVVLLAFVMNMRPILGDSFAARMEKRQTVGWTIARVYDERGHFAGATIFDASGQTVDQCNDELCIARQIQQRRRQLMTDFNTPEGERRALELEYHDTNEKMRQSEASTLDLVESMHRKVPGTHEGLESLNGVLQCKAPENWDSKFWLIRGMRERWLGKDPTFKYAHQWDDHVRITHYGLSGTHFETPEDYVAHLENLFDEPEEVKPITIDGREGELIRLRYHYDDYTDVHGAYFPPRFMYEEFAVLPLKEGFLVFNLDMQRHYISFPSEMHPKGGPDPSLTDREKQMISMAKDFHEYLNSCKILAGK